MSPDLDAVREMLSGPLGDQIREEVATWPPLSRSQLDELAVLLRPAEPDARVA